MNWYKYSRFFPANVSLFPNQPKVVEISSHLKLQESTMTRNLAVIGLVLVGLMMANGQDYSYEYWKDLHARYTVADSINYFSFNFMETIFKENPGNMVISSYAVHQILSMISLGASGAGKKQLESNLYFKGSEEEKLGMKSFNEQFKNFKQYDFKSISKLFHSNSFPINPSFADLMEKYYLQTPQVVDFTKPDEAVKAINEFFQSASNANFQDFLTADKFDEFTRFFIVNAFYFHGKWATAFDPALTIPRPFYYANGTTKDVPMMKTRGFFGTGFLFPEYDVKFIEIPLERKNFTDAISMTIVIPSEKVNTTWIKNNLRRISFSSLKKQDATEFNLYIPKFKFSNSYNLVEPLKKFGISEIFTENADFSGIFDKKIKVDNYFQKSYIVVDEFGATPPSTEASETASQHVQDIYFDKPFFVFITANQVVMSAMCVTDPAY